MGFFSYDEEPKKEDESSVKKIDVTNNNVGLLVSFKVASFLVAGLRKKPDPNVEWLQYVYPFEADGLELLGSTDGSRLHYTPLFDKAVYKVEKSTKTNIVLAQTPCPDYLKESGERMTKVFPCKGDCFDVPYFSVYSEWPTIREYLFSYIDRLSGGNVRFNFEWIDDFAKNLIIMDGTIKIFPPKISPNHPWRFEYYNGDALIFGMVLAAKEAPKQLKSVKTLYPWIDKQEKEKEQKEQIEQKEQREEKKNTVETEDADQPCFSFQEEGSNTAPPAYDTAEVTSDDPF